MDQKMTGASDGQKPEFFQNPGSGSNPGFDLNYSGSLFLELPGFFRFGSNPGSIPTWLQFMENHHLNFLNPKSLEN